MPSPRQRNGDRAHAEQIHLPQPSLLPLFAAVGITLALLGLIFSWPFVAVGAAITLFVIWRWIKAARQDYEELPRA
jgi:hypothetical protein